MTSESFQQEYLNAISIKNPVISREELSLLKDVAKEELGNYKSGILLSNKIINEYKSKHPNNFFEVNSNKESGPNISNIIEISNNTLNLDLNSNSIIELTCSRFTFEMRVESLLISALVSPFISTIKFNINIHDTEYFFIDLTVLINGIINKIRTYNKDTTIIGNFVGFNEIIGLFIIPYCDSITGDDFGMFDLYLNSDDDLDYYINHKDIKDIIDPLVDNLVKFNILDEEMVNTLRTTNDAISIRTTDIVNRFNINKTSEASKNSE